MRRCPRPDRAAWRAARRDRCPSMKIPATHLALPGHFPNQPIVPGVVLLEAVAQALARDRNRVTGFPAIKFLAPLMPEREFDVVLTAKRPGLSAFEIHAGRDKLVSGTVAHDPIGSDAA